MRSWCGAAPIHSRPPPPPSPRCPCAQPGVGRQGPPFSGGAVGHLRDALEVGGAWVLMWTRTSYGTYGQLPEGEATE